MDRYTDKHELIGAPLPKRKKNSKRKIQGMKKAIESFLQIHRFIYHLK